MRRTLSRGSRTRKLACAALRAVAGAVLWAAAAAGPAWAHASLDATTPEAGAALKAAPGQVELRFSEPVETAFGALRVYDAQRHDVHVGAPFHPGGDRSRLAVRLRPRLPDGGYTAVFRVISADSHPASGGFTFDVGTTTSATRAAGVADLLGGAGIGPMTGAMTNLVRAAEYGAIAIGLGGLAVLLLVWLPALRAVATPAGSWQAASDRFDRMVTRVLVAAALVGVAAVALALPLEAAAAQGTT